MSCDTDTDISDWTPYEESALKCEDKLWKSSIGNEGADAVLRHRIASPGCLCRFMGLTTTFSIFDGSHNDLFDLGHGIV